jgi:hypothetical protein
MFDICQIWMPGRCSHVRCSNDLGCSQALAERVIFFEVSYLPTYLPYNPHYKNGQMSKWYLKCSYNARRVSVCNTGGVKSICYFILFYFIFYLLLWYNSHWADPLTNHFWNGPSSPPIAHLLNGPSVESSITPLHFSATSLSRIATQEYCCSQKDARHKTTRCCLARSR